MFIIRRNGQDLKDSVYENKEDTYNFLHYPGSEAVEVSDEEALDIILKDIQNTAEFLASDGEYCVEELFESLKQQYVNNKNPGWKLLAAYMSI